MSWKQEIRCARSNMHRSEKWSQVKKVRKRLILAEYNLSKLKLCAYHLMHILKGLINEMIHFRHIRVVAYRGTKMRENANRSKSWAVLRPVLASQGSRSMTDSTVCA